MPVLLNNVETEVPRLIILRGSPGVGKSTIASKVAALNSAKKKTYIPIDTIQHMDMRKPCKNKEKLGIKNGAVLAKSFLLEGFDVVVDYVFDEVEDEISFLDFVLGDIMGKIDECYVQLFYLDAHIEKVVKRNQSRSGKRGEYMSVPLLRKLYAKTSDTKGSIPNEIIFDTTPYSAKQCARFILSYGKALKNGKELVDIKLPEKDMQRALDQVE